MEQSLLGAARIVAFPVFVLLVVIVPYLLWGDLMDNASATLVERTGIFGYGTLMAGLLAADVLLPVPSSIVAYASVLALGPLIGGAVIFAGMTAGCVLGHYIGRKGGALLARSVAGAQNDARLRHYVERWGWLSLVLMRPVPVLAEASVMIAGAAGMALSAALFATVPANLVVAIVYVYAASWIGTNIGLPTLVFAVILMAAVFDFARRLWSWTQVRRQ